ncbi:hypothetical protein KB874_01555 [Aestuariicoccus sp. KMU-90]|uniref:Uncharacterized protein n=2 Tax=Thetidibacter halocola TaxID=2827239 RepID=A0A8J7WA92_9RHOB|nr:hypothetical protein [Thetidibacter halocola]
MIALGLFSGIAVALWQGWWLRLEAVIASPDHRAALIDPHECREADGYYLTLDGLLGWVGRVYGPPLGWRAFNLCLMLAFLYTLLAALIGLLELLVMIHPTSLPFDRRAYWTAARDNPWNGLALVLMAFTTLLLTLVHVVWAITVWKAQKSDFTRRAVALMHDLADTPTKAQRIEIADLIKRGQPSGFLRGLIYGLPLMAALVLRVYTLIAS